MSRAQTGLAAQALRRALVITEQVRGTDNLDVAPIQSALGDVLREQAQPEAAEAA